tara:strand:+ start:1219 stop:1392 length:174 start_codon:yes stop_codon:yes gene_type:complete
MIDKKSQGYQAISKDLKLKIEKGLALQKVFDKLETALCLIIIEAAYNIKIKEKEKKI